MIFLIPLWIIPVGLLASSPPLVEKTPDPSLEDQVAELPPDQSLAVAVFEREADRVNKSNARSGETDPTQFLLADGFSGNSGYFIKGAFRRITAIRGEQPGKLDVGELVIVRDARRWQPQPLAAIWPLARSLPEKPAVYVVVGDLRQGLASCRFLGPFEVDQYDAVVDRVGGALSSPAQVPPQAESDVNRPEPGPPG